MHKTAYPGVPPARVDGFWCLSPNPLLFSGWVHFSGTAVFQIERRIRKQTSRQLLRGRDDT